MKVFLGWSGEASHQVALALDDWLRKVIQAVKPFVSSEDIAKGARWSSEIAKELQASTFGIICVTKENQDSLWINFEAGALSREIEKSLVVPFLFNLKTSDIIGPLSQFQSVVNEESEILKLLYSINGRLEAEQHLEKGDLQSAFEMWWPKLRDRLATIQVATKKPTPEKRGLEEMVEELLQLARAQQREVDSVRLAQERALGAQQREADLMRQMQAELQSSLHAERELFDRFRDRAAAAEALGGGREALRKEMLPDPIRPLRAVRGSGMPPPPASNDVETK